MKLSEFKQILSKQSNITFALPNATQVPSHFHVTEVGLVSKNFIDCGGTLRQEKKVVFQLWDANDYDHRLHPEKLAKIISLSEKTLNIPDSEIEVEYQGSTIQKFGISFQNNQFHLTNMFTDCLAKENCGVPEGEGSSKQPIQLIDFGSDTESNINNDNSCTPGGGCC